MIEIYAIENRRISLTLFEKMILHLPEKRKGKIKKLRNEEDAVNSLLGETLIRNVASKRFNVKNEDIAIETNEYDKPFLVDFSSFHFNLLFALILPIIFPL